MKTLTDMFVVGMDRVLPDFVPFPEGAVLNVGAGNKQILGSYILDWPQWDADTQPIPYADQSVAGIHAYHFLEHVREPIKMLQEFQRVLMPGGVANIVVPYYNSQMQAQDLDHKACYTEMTWQTLFRNPYYNKTQFQWQFDVGVNVIMGLVERNLCLCTQLIRR